MKTQVPGKVSSLKVSSLLVATLAIAALEFRGVHAADPDVGPPIDLHGAQFGVLFQDRSGFVATWSMIGTNLDSASFLTPNHPGDGWRIAGAGDFDGDSKHDILFQHSDGTLGVWFMNGTEQKVAGLLQPSQPSDPAWGATAVADFNQDGKSDVLFQHTDGTVAVWQMDGLHMVQGSIVNAGQPEDPAWRVAAVADIDRDSNVDLIFQRQGVDSTLGIWYMHGLSVVQGVVSYPVETDWQLVGARDLNNDRNADLVFQHTLGTLGAWYMSGETFESSALFNPSQPGAEWSAVGITDDIRSIAGASSTNP
jgi:hypothetical protein